ncbi:translation initiation factor IF-2 subunit gamma [Candidatus Woesearchaeota archaeon]|nr:translation initiation factor IF-2 subunit gamma [Candidatus Woesearchaeota archaeon]
MPELDRIQPVINIGLVGHVDHGKTTLTERLSGKWTDTHSEEIKRGITIRLGYANTAFVKTKDGKHTTEQMAKRNNEAYTLLRRISFVDAPGHESLMATMLSGATIMDCALLLVAANETCPQPQTKEHLMGLEISGITKIIIVQNKVDLVQKEDALKNYQQIKEFVRGTRFENAPIIPISARHNINVDVLIETIEEHFPTPKRDPSKDPIMFVARSFDVNRPGAPLSGLAGGVLGGALQQGTLHVGDEIEIKPGRMVEERNQKIYKPLFTKVAALMTGDQKVEEAYPGGSIAIATYLDPSLVKSDTLTGSVVGLPGKLPPVWQTLKLETHLLEKVVGIKEDTVVDPLKMGETLMLNANSAATVGVVSRLSKDVIECKLKLPICTAVGSRITISRRMGTRFRLIGYGIIKE